MSTPSTDTVYVVSSSAINRFNYALEDLVEEEEESSGEESSTEDAETEDSEAENTESD